jgi:hypothetical protein
VICGKDGKMGFHSQKNTKTSISLHSGDHEFETVGMVFGTWYMFNKYYLNANMNERYLFLKEILQLPLFFL